MKRNKFSIFTFATALTSSALLMNCSAAGTSATAGGGGSTSTLSEYASALAEDLVLTSPTAQRAAGSILNVGPKYTLQGGVSIMTGPAADDSPKEKKDALETLLADAAPFSCAIALNLQNAGRANCYGPNVDFTNHEFDNSSGQYPGGDLGIWVSSESPSSEACAAAQLNQQMKGVISYVDTAQFIAAGMACVANKTGKAFPTAASTSVDLTSDMSGIVTVNTTALMVSSAVVAREADDGSGNPVYVTTLSGTVGTKTISIRVKHISTATDDSTNKGKISVKVTDTSGAGSTDGASLEYEKSSSSVAKLQLKSVNFNTSSIADPFVSGTNYSVNLSSAWNGNANYLLAEIDPTKFTGTFIYAWQAGNADSHARTFNAKLSESSGVVTGTAFFGFGPRMQVGPGAISGMICNWAGPGNDHNTVPAKVQRQDMTLTSGKFVVTGTSHTTFDPVVSCESNSGTMTLSWNGGASTANVNATTENLSPLSDVASVLTIPTAPTNVD